MMDQTQKHGKDDTPHGGCGQQKTEIDTNGRTLAGNGKVGNEMLSLRDKVFGATAAKARVLSK